MDDSCSWTGTVREWTERLGLTPDGSERRMWYGEGGPPDHFVFDESGNICFLVRDHRVIDYYELFP